MVLRTLAVMAKTMGKVAEENQKSQGWRGEDGFVDNSTSGGGPTPPFASPFQCPDEEAVEFSAALAGRKATARMRRWERAMECVLTR